MDVTIERVSVATDEIRQLVAELDRALTGPYLPEQHHYLPFERLFDNNVRFFAARIDGVAVGCGGLAFYDGFAEVKRMFTQPTARRRGVAAAEVGTAANGCRRSLQADASGARVVLDRGLPALYAA